MVDLVIGSEPCSLVEMGAARVSTPSLSETSAGCPGPKVTISPEPWRLVVMDPGRSRQWALTSIFSPSTFSRDERASDTIFGKALAKTLQVSWSTSKSCSSEISKSALGVVAANIPSTSVDLESESFRTSSCRRPVFYPVGARQKVSSCFPRFIVFPDLGVFPGCWLAVCRYFLPLIAALGNVRLCYESWLLDSRLLHSRRWNIPIEVYLAKRHSQSLFACW